jgi:hypothetical protein
MLRLFFNSIFPKVCVCKYVMLNSLTVFTGRRWWWWWHWECGVSHQCGGKQLVSLFYNAQQCGTNHSCSHLIVCSHTGSKLQGTRELGSRDLLAAPHGCFWCQLACCHHAADAVRLYQATSILHTSCCSYILLRSWIVVLEWSLSIVMVGCLEWTMDDAANY